MAGGLGKIWLVLGGDTDSGCKFLMLAQMSPCTLPGLLVLILKGLGYLA